MDLDSHGHLGHPPSLPNSPLVVIQLAPDTGSSFRREPNHKAGLHINASESLLGEFASQEMLTNLSKDTTLREWLPKLEHGRRVIHRLPKEVKKLDFSSIDVIPKLYETSSR